jgi:hypothetical protein
VRIEQRVRVARMRDRTVRDMPRHYKTTLVDYSFSKKLFNDSLRNPIIVTSTDPKDLYKR